jgi:branched-chain amino acid transport system substrate-binding protein
VVPFSSGEVGSFSALAREAMLRRPDAVLLVAGALDTAALSQQLRKQSAEVRILGTDWGFTSDVLAHAGATVEGAIFTQKVNLADRSPALVRFQEAYQARFERTVDFAAVQGYDAVQLLAAALRRDPTRAGVRRAVLATGTWPALAGPVTIDRFGDAHRPQLIGTVREGRFVIRP